MATYTRNFLSASVNGKLIAISATATPGTLLHTATAGSGYDEVYLWVSNPTSATITLTVQWGGVTAADQLVTSYNIPPNSPPMPIANGQNINGGNLIRAFGSAAGLLASGFVTNILN